MAAPQNFRTAINGFRREDVVRYLEYLNAKHVTELNQVSAEADALREKISALQAKLSQNEETADTASQLEKLNQQLEKAQQEKKVLEETLAGLQNQAPSCGEELTAAKQENDSLKARCAALEAELNTLKAQEPAHEQNLANQELEAYRRAERAERLANEKADLIYHRTNAILDEASGKIEGASADLGQLAERINSQLQQMQYSINSSKIALKGAVDTMHALRVDKN